MRLTKCLIILALSSSTLVFAGPGQVGSANEPKAQSKVDEIQGLYNVGLASRFDVLLAQKYDLELRLRKDSADYEAFKELSENALERLQLVNSEFNSGIASSDAVLLVKGEVAGLSATCQGMLATAQKQYAFGLKSQQQMQLLQSTCEALAGR